MTSQKTSKQPKVTVVITTFRRSDTLARAIRSVLGQTYANIELIVVDDNNDGDEYRLATGKLMRKFTDNPAVQYITHTTNQNGGAARNTGIRAAGGYYITFLDDDDFYLPHRIEALVAAMTESTSAGAAYTGTAFVQNHKITGLQPARAHDDYLLELLCQNSFFGTGSNFICITKYVKQIDGFDVSFRRHQDIEFMIRYIDKYGIMPVDDISVVKVTDSTLNYPGPASIIATKQQFLDKFSSLIDAYPPATRDHIYATNYQQLALITAGAPAPQRRIVSTKTREYGGIPAALHIRIITKRWLYNSPVNYLRSLAKSIVYAVKPHDRAIDELIYNTLNRCEND